MGTAIAKLECWRGGGEDRTCRIEYEDPQLGWSVHLMNDHHHVIADEIPRRKLGLEDTIHDALEQWKLKDK